MKTCDYGCGQEAKYKFKNGKYCCSVNFHKCPFQIEKFSGKNNPMFRKIPWNKGKKNCFSTEVLEKMSLAKKNYVPWIKGKKHSLKSRKKLSASCMGRKVTELVRKKIADSNKRTIEKIKEKYPFFSKIEEMRYNPDKPEEKEIQVHCKNHACPNSKEQSGWFTPTSRQLEHRILNLEREGKGEANFYCSDKCKKSCPLYGLQSDPYKKPKNISTSSEYESFRNFVLERDNYECQYCGEKAEHVHHERPQKLEPFFMFDPDYAWSVCKECHNTYGHKDGCSVGKLAKIVC